MRAGSIPAPHNLLLRPATSHTYASARKPSGFTNHPPRRQNMFLKTLTIEGYKHFGKKFSVEFSRGLNVLVGENGAGKSAIIDGIRLLLLEDEYGRGGVTDADFHRPFTKDATRSSGITISGLFGGLTKEETVAFLPWVVGNDQATLNLEVENKETSRGWFKRTLWGGESRASMFERELEPTISARSDLGERDLPWMPDRLDTLAGLLCDCDVLTEKDGTLRLGPAAGEVK